MNEGHRHAILIGSSRFDKEPALSQLNCPENDVNGMHEILSAPDLGSFQKLQVFKNAESYAVMHRIEETLSKASNTDQVLIYYSGHGKMDLQGRLYLATTNTEVNKLVTTSIPIETLRMLIENSLCRKIILILDCCFAGAAGRSFMNIRGGIDEKLQELARGNGVYILTASTASQTAQDREGDVYGLLTAHIVSGIRLGAADANHDGLVSMDDLYQYVYAKVKSEGYQEPMRWALNAKGEDLIISRASSRVPIGDQQQILTDKVVAIRLFLPSRIFSKAIQVIDERRAPFYSLVFRLYREQWPVGRFIEEWNKAEEEALATKAEEHTKGVGQAETPLIGPSARVEKETESRTKRAKTAAVGMLGAALGMLGLIMFGIILSLPDEIWPDNVVTLLDVATRKKLVTIKPFLTQPKLVAFSPDGKIIALGGDETIRQWDVTTGQVVDDGFTLQIRGSVRSIAFSPSGKTIASASEEGEVKLWNLESSPLRLILAHSFNTVFSSVAISPDVKTIAAGIEDSRATGKNSLKLWDVTTGKELVTIQEWQDGRVRSITFSPDGKTITAGIEDSRATGKNSLKLWDVTTGKELVTIQEWQSTPFMSIAFSPDGKTIASSSPGNTIKLWNVMTAKEFVTLQGHVAAVTSVAFSPNGKIIASGCRDSTAKLWDVATGKELVTLQNWNSKSEVSSIAFSPSGNILAVGISRRYPNQ